MRLYSVTTVREEKAVNVNGREYMTTRPRCVGVFSTLEKAKEIIEENIGDIFEYWNPWAVIEVIHVDSLYGGFDRKEYWYEWKGYVHSGKYVSIEAPDKWKNVVGWGIG